MTQQLVVESNDMLRISGFEGFRLRVPPPIYLPKPLHMAAFRLHRDSCHCWISVHLFRWRCFGRFAKIVRLLHVPSCDAAIAILFTFVAFVQHFWRAGEGACNINLQVFGFIFDTIFSTGLLWRLHLDFIFVFDWMVMT